MENLEYFVSVRSPYVVVTLLRPLGKDSDAMLDEIMGEVEQSKASFVVLCFQGVASVDRHSVPALIRFQKEVRELTNSELRLCNMLESVSAFLLESGAIRKTEVHATMIEALRSIVKSQKDAAIEARDKAAEATAQEEEAELVLQAAAVGDSSGRG